MTNKQKNQSWQYLVNALPKKYNDKLFNFLCEWYFDTKQSLESCTEICAIKAYPDMARRTLDWDKNTHEETKISWRDKVAKNVLVPRIVDLLAPNVSFNESFNEWHKNVCYEIIKHKHENLSVLYIGQAQKWLNMTLKNMLVHVTADWYKNLDELRKDLHVPVDTYVMEAAYSQLGIRTLENGSGKLLADAKLSDGNNKFAWSKIKSYELYFAFQEKIIKVIRQREDYSCPIDWEFDAWLGRVGEK